VYRSIAVDHETYWKLKQIAERLNITMGSLIRLITYGLDVEDTGDYVTLVLYGDLLKTRRIRVVENQYIEYLEDSNLKLREKVEKLLNEISKLKRELKTCKKIPESKWENPFIKALREHGLLSLAKEYVLGLSDEITNWVNEDALYIIQRIKDEILEAPAGESQERKKLEWVI